MPRFRPTVKRFRDRFRLAAAGGAQVPFAADIMVNDGDEKVKIRLSFGRGLDSFTAAQDTGDIALSYTTIIPPP